MPLFTPPTVKQSVGGDRLFSRFGTQVGQSVVKVDGTYTLTPFPWLGDIKDLEPGVDYFLGGHEYVVSEALAIELEAAGFEVSSFPGYGEGGYGYGPYGS